MTLTLPKQMAAVMNTTAASHSEILLMRNTINIKVPFFNLTAGPFGDDCFLHVSRHGKPSFKFNCYIFTLCVDMLA